MKIIVYINISSNTADFFKRVLSRMDGVEIEFGHTHADFIRSLRRQLGGNRIILFEADDDGDLAFILSVKELLADNRLILILPDHSVQSISRGHRLSPRYQSVNRRDYSDVIAVLERMARHEAKIKASSHNRKRIDRVEVN